jgi:predicted secreted protein
MVASTGKTGRSVVFKIGDQESPENYTTVANVSSINLTGRQADEIDFTHLASTGGFRELQQGFKDPGTIQLSLHFDPTNATHDNSAAGIEGLLNSGTEFNWQIDFSGVTGWSDIMTGRGYVQGSDINVTVDDPITADVTVRVTGAVEFITA